MSEVWFCYNIMPTVYLKLSLTTICTFRFTLVLYNAVQAKCKVGLSDSNFARCK